MKKLGMRHDKNNTAVYIIEVSAFELVSFERFLAENQATPDWKVTWQRAAHELDLAGVTRNALLRSVDASPQDFQDENGYLLTFDEWSARVRANYAVYAERGRYYWPALIRRGIGQNGYLSIVIALKKRAGEIP